MVKVIKLLLCLQHGTSNSSYPAYFFDYFKKASRFRFLFNRS